MKFPEKLQRKMNDRKQANALRSLGEKSNTVDFSSNDYLGFARSNEIFEATHHFLKEINDVKNGATGSRLISGNFPLFEKVEQRIAAYHNAEGALLYNSGYTANVGFFSCVPQRGDIVLYDEFIHASIRDGIQLSNTKSYKFSHNNIAHLIEKIENFRNNSEENNNVLYVVTESVFSMDGDSPDISKMVEVCKQYNAYLVVDEAHALGVFGANGLGLVQELHLEEAVFARIITYGKGLGCHGAAVLGNTDLIHYLQNFSRSFIYTTGLSPHAVATIITAYEHLLSSKGALEQQKLKSNILFFKEMIQKESLEFIESNSPIHGCIISGNERVKSVARELKLSGFDIKPILSPTVPEGKERLRFCLHSYNTHEEIREVLKKLATFAAQ